MYNLYECDNRYYNVSDDHMQLLILGQEDIKTTKTHKCI